MPTTISGNIKDLGIANVVSGCFLRFQLRGTTGNQPRVSGTALIAQGVGTGQGYFFDFNPDANGNITGTLYSTRDATGLLGGDIETGGVTTAVWYEMSLWRNGKKLSSIHCHAKNGATLNISTVTPISTSPIASAPAGDATYLRLDGANANVITAVPYSATPVFALPLSPSVLTVFTIPLTGNVASSTLTGTAPGIIAFKFTQPAGGNSTFVYPANVKGGQAPDPGANAISFQAFFFDGTNAYPLGDMTVN